MWFKNAIVYRFNRDIDIQLDELETQLHSFKFKPCGHQETQTLGWTSLIEQHSDRLQHQVNDAIILKAKKEEKILPAPVIKELLDDKVNQVELAENRTLTKAEKDTLKENIIFELLPRAFARRQVTQLLILKDCVVVDAPSHNKAEEVLTLLRKTLGSLPVVPVSSEQPVEYTFTQWLKNEAAPQGFTILQEAELKSKQDDGGMIRCKQQDLSAEEIHAHIDAGKFVTELALDWQQRIQFLFTEDCRLKRLKFSDEVKQQNQDMHDEDPFVQFDADMTLLAGEFNAFLPEVFAAVAANLGHETLAD